MTGISDPRLRKTVDFLRTLVRSSACAESGRLPPVRTLARETGVSIHVVLKAVERLKREGVLMPVRGKGILIAARIANFERAQRLASSSPGAPRKAKWRTVKQRILRDIGTGRYLPGSPLPSMKELRETYGVCYQPLKKALQSLEDAAVVARHKKTYVIPPEASPHRGVIAVHFPQATQSPRGEEFFRAVEQQCYRKNLDFSTIIYRKDGVPASRQSSLLDRMHDRSTVLGHAVWAFGFEDPMRLVSRLSPDTQPVAVFDECGDIPGSVMSTAGAKCRFFRIGSSEVAPRLVARYLLRLGHSHVAYVSPLFTHPWTRIRYRILESVCTEVNPQSSVRLFALESDTDDDKLRRQFRVLHRGPELISLLSRLRDFLPPRDGRLSDTLARNVSSYMKSIEREPYVDGFFEPILRCREITAWVVSNDLDACIALDFLHRHGVAVPGRISLVSFDDGRESYDNNITSYNFNIPAIVSAALDTIVRPALARTIHDTPVVDIEGMIVRRLTCGRAR